jgi:plasmid stabilization system protein ParE
MAHDVLIPPQVAAEIEAIGDYIAQDNPVAARAMMERLYRRCLSLDHFPERGRPYGPTYRAVNEGRYVIVYRVEPTPRQGRVVIVAVMHASRDIRRILGIQEG